MRSSHLENNLCNLGCNTSSCATGSHLCPGCSDPYTASLNAGPNLGSRAWVNPFTGFFPSNPDPNDHSGHVHNGVSHRIIVEVDDLNTTLNPGATYFAEAAYRDPNRTRPRKRWDYIRCVQGNRPVCWRLSL